MIRKSASGQALVIGAFAMVALLAVMGLAIDMGVMRYDKRMQQTAADAAAIAGAVQLAHYGVGTSEVAPAALNASAANGFTNSVGSGGCPTSVASLPTNLAVGAVQVTVCNGPISGPHSVTNSAFPKALPADYVQVFVSAGQPTFFMKVLGVDSETIMASAVATNVTGGTVNGPGCIYTLEGPLNQPKITAAQSASLGTSGSVYLNAPTCGINDNGDFVANGGAQLSVTAASITYAGQYNPPSSSATISPTPAQSSLYVSDPIASYFTANDIAPPTVGSPTGATSGSPCIQGGAPSAAAGVTTTFCPGTYSSITVNSNADAVFEPGVYVIDGGNFKINGGAQVCGGGTAEFSGGLMTSCVQDSAGDGVTFYLTCSSTSCASVFVSGTAYVKFYAPNYGTYEGILFWQDPSDTQPASLLGNNNSSYQGALYFPSATLNFGGDTSGFNSTAMYTIIVVNQLQFYGNPDVNINTDYSALAGNGGPLSGAISTAVLVQ